MNKSDIKYKHFKSTIPCIITSTSKLWTYNI